MISPCSLSSERDEAIVAQTVGSVLRDTGKGFVVWVKDNQTAVELKVLLEMILSRPTASLNTQPQRSFAGDFSTPTNAASVSAARKVQSPPGYHMISHPLLETHDVPLRQKQTFNQLYQTLPKQTPDPVSGREYLPPVGGFVMIKTRLFRGIISYKPSDMKFFFRDLRSQIIYRESCRKNIPTPLKLLLKSRGREVVDLFGPLLRIPRP